MFQRISLRNRLLIIPSIAIVGFALIIFLNWLFARQVTELTEQIQGSFVVQIRDGFVPGVETTRDLKRILMWRREGDPLWLRAAPGIEIAQSGQQAHHLHEVVSGNAVGLGNFTNGHPAVIFQTKVD